MGGLIGESKRVTFQILPVYQIEKNTSCQNLKPKNKNWQKNVLKYLLTLDYQISNRAANLLFEKNPPNMFFFTYTNEIKNMSQLHVYSVYTLIRYLRVLS